MTGIVEHGKARLQCDSCSNKSEGVSNNNQVRAQRVAITFFGWRVYTKQGQHAKVWKHACPTCAERFRSKK